MRPVEIIIKKRDGGTLLPEEIRGFIDGYIRDEVADYQAAAFLMAAFLKGLDFEETAALTRAMMESGDVYNLDDLGLGITVDKHSTGGVGDKVSLVLAPLVAACEVAVPMVSGRGLGHTGGTLDKLESIPGFNVKLSEKTFRELLQKLGVAMAGQTENFVPADRRLYALRDVIGTVENIPLICASIMSKKVASGAHALVMDVKFGTGAFMPTLDKARELARGLMGVGKALGRPVHALITDMNQPLGDSIGNSLEVREAIDCLHGKGPNDFREVVIELSAEMLILGKKSASHDEAKLTVEKALDTGAAFERFREMVQAQGGDVNVLDDPNKLDISSQTVEFTAESSGYIGTMDCRSIGNAAVVLGAGREKTSDTVDYGVGLVFHVQIGDKVEPGQPLATVYHRNKRGLEGCLARLKKAVPVQETAVERPELIRERMTSL